MASRQVIRKRRQRRQNRQVIKHGRSSKPTHKLIGGRTGAVHEKRMKAQKGKGDDV